LDLISTFEATSPRHHSGASSACLPIAHDIRLCFTAGAAPIAEARWPFC